MSTCLSISSLEFSGISGSSSSNPLFTPSESGLYRISTYFETTVNSDRVNGGGDFQYTDGGGAQVSPMPTSFAGSGGSVVCSPVLLHLVGGNAVTFDLNVSGSTVFNAYFVIEKLG